MITAQGSWLLFNGSTLGRITDIDAEFNSPLREIHPLSSGAVDEAGRYMPIFEKTACDHKMSITALAEGFNTAAVGSKGPLVAGGSGWSINFPCAVMESLKCTAKVGDLMRVSYTFRRSWQ